MLRHATTEVGYPLTLPACAETVIALAERASATADSAAVGELLLRDPGALLAHFCLVAGPAAGSEWSSPRLLLGELERGRGDCFADWSHPAALRAYQASQAIGRAAGILAERSGLPAERAQAAGVLAPLGHLSLACQADANGQEPNALTRHLARRLPLPDWLSQTLLQVDLPADPAARLTLVVQAAIGLVLQKRFRGFPLQTGPRPHDALEALGLPATAASLVQPALETLAVPPRSLPAEAAALFWRAIRIGQGSSLVQDTAHTARLEAEAEALRAQIDQARSRLDGRLRDAKLRALAELAAGAGHEINNPLAVISGQAQHLLQTEESSERVRALERIIAQSRRIHALLRDLMLYARPPEPRLRSVLIAKLVRQTARSLLSEAAERRVRLEVVPGKARLALQADPALLSAAVACLVRNAIEAAPADGWARIRVESSPDLVEIIVEDNGPGLSPHQSEHLFDPFFSGRSAGRGSGLGLSKVWRIAELHGGNIELVQRSGEPTRFVLALPPKRAARSQKPNPRQASAARRKVIQGKRQKVKGRK